MVVEGVEVAAAVGAAHCAFYLGTGGEVTDENSTTAVYVPRACAAYVTGVAFPKGLTNEAEADHVANSIVFLLLSDDFLPIMTKQTGLTLQRRPLVGSRSTDVDPTSLRFVAGPSRGTGVEGTTVMRYPDTEQTAVAPNRRGCLAFHQMAVVDPGTSGALVWAYNDPKTAIPIGIYYGVDATLDSRNSARGIIVPIPEPSELITVPTIGCGRPFRANVFCYDVLTWVSIEGVQIFKRGESECEALGCGRPI